MILLCVAINCDLALAGPPAFFFEIKHHGGYRDPAAPDPYIALRVYGNGRVGCHCPDRERKYRWVQGQVSVREVQQLRETIQELGFLDLKGGLSRWQARWFAWENDAGVTVYSAQVDGEKKTYRSTMDFSLESADEAKQVLRRLDEAAKPFRERLCGPEPRLAPSG